MTAYDKAVQDYKNSASVQMGLASYHTALNNVKEIYPKIINNLTALYGEDVTKKVIDGQRMVANQATEYQLMAKESANARLENDLKRLGAKQSAIYDQERVNTKLENYRISLLERRSKEKHNLRQEIDNKTKLVFINEGAFANKQMTVGKLQTTLLFLTLIAFISYISYMGIFSSSTLGWILTLSILGYVVTMIRRFYWKDIFKAEFDVLNFMAPNYMARMCPEGC